MNLGAFEKRLAAVRKKQNLRGKKSKKVGGSSERLIRAREKTSGY